MCASTRISSIADPIETRSVPESLGHALDQCSAVGIEEQATARNLQETDDRRKLLDVVDGQDHWPGRVLNEHFDAERKRRPSGPGSRRSRRNRNGPIDDLRQRKVWH